MPSSCGVKLHKEVNLDTSDCIQIRFLCVFFTLPSDDTPQKPKYVAINYLNTHVVVTDAFYFLITTYRLTN
jgi:hypothetical protein